MSDQSTDRWFLSRPGISPWTARVYCFPHAGGNARSFLRWQDGLEDEAELVAVRTPGRGERANEPMPSFDQIIDGAAEAIAREAELSSRPVYLLGHSLGALMAFEVARRLRSCSSLRHLVASGLMAPSHLPSPRVLRLATLEGKEFVEALGFFGGMPPELIADEEVHDLVLPGLIVDFRLAASYRYMPAPPLGIDITLINGRDDPHVGANGLAAWRDECRNQPASHLMDGGHFYFEGRPTAITDILLEVIRADQHVELL